MNRLILASASPRRKRLMRWLGLPFETDASCVEERLEPGGDPVELSQRLALEKAREAASRHSGEECLVLGFDTVVALDGRLLGKPESRREAERMLRDLSGRVHEVTTGVAIVDCSPGEEYTFSETTTVRMKRLGESTIRGWLETEEPMGCAGAYNIERHLASVEEDECFQNVPGLPVCRLASVLEERFGLRTADPKSACESARKLKCHAVDPLAP